MEIQVKIKKIINKPTSNYLIAEVEFMTYPKGETPPTANHIIAGEYFFGVHVGDVFEVSGDWVDNRKHGIQFKAERILLKFPERIEGYEKFLRNNIDGISRKTAKTLVEAFGDDLFKVIENAPERLTESGISEKMAERIKAQVQKFSLFRKNSTELYWLTTLEVNELIKEFNFGAYDVLRENPYFCTSVIGFERCEFSAHRLGMGKDNPKRVAQVIFEVLKAELKDGHLYTDITELFFATQKRLDSSKFFERFELSEALFLEGLEALAYKNKITVEKNRVYLRYSHNAEEKIVKMLSEFRKLGQDLRQEEKVREFLKEKRKSGILLEEEQENAVLMAMGNKISILTGGPGTGKTFVAGAIIEAIKKTQPLAKIVLAAPTGKAAKRMTEITGMPSSTIHRLLEIREETDEPERELDTDYVIIDESSMLDVFLFSQLLSAIPNHAKLLLIGDYNQLPSVGPGLIFRDFTESECLPTTKLTKIHRQAEGSQIIKNAYNILNEKMEMERDNTKGDFFFLEREGAENIRATIFQAIDKMLEKGILLESIQIITPQNVGDLGTIVINKKIQEQYNKNKAIEGTEFRVGDKVMHTENNADLDVFNGETGIVMGIKMEEEDKKIVVNFGDKEVTYTEEFFHQLCLNYASTVHKMQGSEADVIIMIISKEHKHMMNKGILYTGLTRAKNRVVVIGEEQQYFEAVKNSSNTIRRSGIKEKVSA